MIPGKSKLAVARRQVVRSDRDADTVAATHAGATVISIAIVILKNYEPHSVCEKLDRNLDQRDHAPIRNDLQSDAYHPRIE